jgi:hypothetical protein
MILQSMTCLQKQRSKIETLKRPELSKRKQRKLKDENIPGKTETRRNEI